MTLRVDGRQQHRTNAPASSPEECYKRNLAIPFVNHINAFDLKDKYFPFFSSLLVISFQFVLCSEGSHQNIVVVDA